jgi:hypothetical protein
MILRGADGRAALAQILSTPLSDDRRVDWLAAGAEQLAAFVDPGALERTVAHPIGPTPARAFLHLRVVQARPRASAPPTPSSASCRSPAGCGEHPIHTP